MARKLRVEYAGACYHVINRGNYRSDIFAARGAESFQRCLVEAAERFGWRLHAFVIMRNHFHLAVETPEPNLSEGMKWLQCTWAIRFNRFRGEVGHPFQGRYKGIHVERGTSLARVANYIHLNPICAGLVPVERVADYRWSSLPWFLGAHRQSLLESSVLPYLSDPSTALRCATRTAPAILRATSSTSTGSPRPRTPAGPAWV